METYRHPQGIDISYSYVIDAELPFKYYLQRGYI